MLLLLFEGFVGLQVFCGLVCLFSPVHFFVCVCVCMWASMLRQILEEHLDVDRIFMQKKCWEMCLYLYFSTVKPAGYCTKKKKDWKEGRGLKNEVLQCLTSRPFALKISYPCCQISSPEDCPVGKLLIHGAQNSGSCLQKAVGNTEHTGTARTLPSPRARPWRLKPTGL